MRWFETYEEAEEMVAEYLNSIKNVKLFCNQHNLCYLNVLEIRRRKAKTAYPKIVKKVLELMGYEVEQKLCFELKKPD